MGVAAGLQNERRRKEGEEMKVERQAYVWDWVGRAHDLKHGFSKKQGLSGPRLKRSKNERCSKCNLLSNEIKNDICRGFRRKLNFCKNDNYVQIYEGIVK